MLTTVFRWQVFESENSNILVLGTRLAQNFMQPKSEQRSNQKYVVAWISFGFHCHDIDTSPKTLPGMNSTILKILEIECEGNVMSILVIEQVFWMSAMVWDICKITYLFLKCIFLSCAWSKINSVIKRSSITMHWLLNITIMQVGFNVMFYKSLVHC